MEFKEFTEFENYEENDYDIKVGSRSEENIYRDKFNELYFKLGAPEYFELAPYGITEATFENPTKEDCERLLKYAENLKNYEPKRSNGRR